MTRDEMINKLLDETSRSMAQGNRSTSIADLLSYFNHRSVGVATPVRIENSGITFFTRPNMNLSYDNLSADRILTPLLTDNPLTYQRVVRSMLDPISSGLSLVDHEKPGKIKTPLFDEKQAFMPLLSNNLLSLSGWPDIALDTYSSHEGILRENWSMVDGTSKTYQSFDLQASFRNIGGDPITLLLLIWATYMDHVHRGVMTPYMSSIVMNRVDYQTRIFKFNLDPTRMRIQKWCSGMGAFPVGVPIGADMNYTSEEPYVTENMEQISTGFRVQGVEYMDPILFNEFNETVAIFNPNMADGERNKHYIKIPYQHLDIFNWSGYPHINELTNELEWWVDREFYIHRMNNQDNAHIPSDVSDAFERYTNKGDPLITDAPNEPLRKDTYYA